MTRSLLLLATLAGITTGSNAQQTGDLDPTFGVGGIVITDFHGEFDMSFDGVIQPDGRVVLAGQAWIDSVRHFALARYMPNGELDTSFGIGGLVTTFVGTWGRAEAVALQPDGGIVVAGWWDASLMDRGIVVARYTLDGVLDATFNGDGLFTWNPSVNEDILEDIVVQPDGKIIVSGNTQFTGSEVLIMRFNPDGTPDNSFSSDGIQYLNSNSIGTGRSIVLRPDGRIVIVGGGYGSIGLVQLTSDGAVDATFGTNGFVGTPVGPSDDLPYAAVMQPEDGKIIVCGKSGYTPSYLLLVRYNLDGTLDNGFGVGGAYAYSPGAVCFFHDVALLPDGRIAAAGINMTEKFKVGVFHADGSLDSTFSGDGLQAIEHGVTLGCNWIEVQNDGKLILGGSYSPGNPLQNDFTLMRLQMDLNVGLIEFTSTESEPLFYPNPIAQSATLRYTLAADERITIALVDMEGRTVQRFLDNVPQQAGEQRLDLTLDASLAPGSYLLTITSAEGRKVSVQVEKQ